MRSSDRNSGGGRNPRGGSGSGGGDRRGGGADRPGAGDQRRGDGQAPKRPSRPRPEERRYDVGSTGQSGASKPGGMPRTKSGAAKPGAGADTGKGSARRGRKTLPARPRELDAQIEERNRERHTKPKDNLPKTFPGAEQEGERLQKVLARAGMGSRRAASR